jgi:protein subunit release factor B
MTTKTLLFSVTLDDCELQHFRSGGSGGQHQNTSDSGTRIIHTPSGARGECREERSQLANKKRAFRRMVDDPLFRLWVHQEVRRLEGDLSSEAEVDRMLADPRQIKVEVRDSSTGAWREVPYSDPLDRVATISGSAVHVRGTGKRKASR